MPRRRALTEAQLENLLALPTTEADLVRHWTLDRADLAAVDRRRGGHNQLGFALQLCAFRYPGRLLRPGELIPAEALRFVAEQLHIEPETLATSATRPQTRREQLDGLRVRFGFRMFAPGHGRTLLAWLLPVALATTGAPAIAHALMEELRRRRVIAPGPSIIERLVAAALVLAERHVAHQLTRGLTPAQAAALDALLRPKEGTPLSMLAWARQPPGAPGHRALARIIEQIGILRTVGLDPACAEGVHPERLRKLAREGGRFTAQHLRALSPLRRRSTLVATVLDTTARLTDDGVGLFDRAVGRMFRRAEAREENAVLRDARAANDKVRLFAKLGAALIAAKETDADLDGAVVSAVGWEKLAASVAEAERLARPDKVNLPALAVRAWPVLHRLGPLFLDAFQLRAMPDGTATLRAVELLHGAYRSGGRTWPRSPPTSFLRPVWREAVLDSGSKGVTGHRRVWEAATLLALRERLRAGDIWVAGRRQWRAVEDQLIPPALFTAMREAGPLPVAVPATAAGVPGRAPCPAGTAHGGDQRQSRGRRVGRRPDQRRRAEDHAAQGDHPGGGGEGGRTALRHDAERPHHQRAGRRASLDRVRRRLHPLAYGPASRRPPHRAHRRAGRRHQPRPDPHGGRLLGRELSQARLDRGLAPARGHLPSGPRHSGQRPAAPPACGPVRGRGRVQLGWPALSHH